jgi:hypothetical protein
MEDIHDVQMGNCCMHPKPRTDSKKVMYPVLYLQPFNKHALNISGDECCRKAYME